MCWLKLGHADPIHLAAVGDIVIHEPGLDDEAGFLQDASRRLMCAIVASTDFLGSEHPEAGLRHGRDGFRRIPLIPLVPIPEHKGQLYPMVRGGHVEDEVPDMLLGISPKHSDEERLPWPVTGTNVRTRPLGIPPLMPNLGEADHHRIVEGGHIPLRDILHEKRPKQKPRGRHRLEDHCSFLLLMHDVVMDRHPQRSYTRSPSCRVASACATRSAPCPSMSRWPMALIAARACGSERRHRSASCMSLMTARSPAQPTAWRNPCCAKTRTCPSWFAAVRTAIVGQPTRASS